MLSRPCRKRRASSHNNGRISWGFFRAAAQRVGFSSSYDGELREPLLWTQGSPVSIGVARRSEALLSIHHSGIQPQDALKWGFRGFSRVAAGNPGFPRLVTVTSGSFSLCLLEVRNTVDLGEASRTPPRLVQWKSTSSPVGVGTSEFLSCFDVGLGLCMLFQTGR